MKKLFIESLIKAAIEREDFMPLTDEQGNVSINSIINVLIKQSFGGLVLLELIDADAMTGEQIKARLEENSIRLANMKAAASHFVFELFIFETEPDEEKLNIIEEGQVHNTMNKKYLKCISLSLSSKRIIKHFKAPLTDYGIGNLINKLLETGQMSGTTIEEIKDIIKQKAKDYDIEYKTEKPVITYALIAVNILVFVFINLYSFKSGSNYNTLLNVFGEKDNLKILSGEYWRFVTPIFLHANTIHLLVNCFSLYAVGITVEKIYGHVRFMIIYIIAGILGNIASFMFSANFGVGASGSIFGLMGALLYFGLERPSLFKKYFGYNVITTIIINLVYGFTSTGIDNFAHIGGLIGGFLSTGVVKAANKPKWYLNRYIFLLLTLVLVCTGLLYGFNSKQNKKLYFDMQQYSQSKEELSEAKRLNAGYKNIDELLGKLNEITNGKK